jgi:hypothetical protein
MFSEDNGESLTKIVYSSSVHTFVSMACIPYCSSLYPFSKFWLCGEQWWDLAEFFVYAQERKSSGVTYWEEVAKR